MPQEVRSILFAAEEVHTAVVEALMLRVRGLSPHQVDRVDMRMRDNAVYVVVTFAREIGAKRALDPLEVMSAMLAYCRKLRIPLAHRAQKRMAVVGNCLVLTTGLRLDAIDPVVIGKTVLHHRADPELAKFGV